MWYVGLDVHLKTTSICILNVHGEQVRQRRAHGSWDVVLKYLRQIDHRRDVLR